MTKRLLRKEQPFFYIGFITKQICAGAGIAWAASAPP
jgi:hypothetical protein